MHKYLVVFSFLACLISQNTNTVYQLHRRVSITSSPTDISVKDYGAIGDGVTDDTRSIQNANDQAALLGKKLLFPEGVYLVSTLRPTTSWEGDNATIKRDRTVTGSPYDFCKVNGVNNISFTSLTFDGDVSPDPQPIDSSSCDRYVGCVSFFLINSNNVILDDCKFINSYKSNLRIENSSYITIDSCQTGHARGIFGDGSYVTGSNHIYFKNCQASDYTRIGFVLENNTYEATFENCTASDGHDGSIMYKGTEYNAGFWFEHSANVSVSQCIATRNTHYGFVATTGIAKKVFLPPSAFFRYDQSSSIQNGSAGFLLSSAGDIPVSVQISSCQVLTSSQGFVASARHSTDSFSFTNCNVDLTFSQSNLNNVAFMWESSPSFDINPNFSYDQCAIMYVNPIKGNLLSGNSNSADISTYSGGKANIYINNMSNKNNGGVILLKSRKGNPDYIIENSDVDTTYLTKRNSIILNNSSVKKVVM